MKEKLRITGFKANTEFMAKTLINGDWYVLTTDFYMMTEGEFKSNPAHKPKEILRVTFLPSKMSWEVEYNQDDVPLPVRPSIKDGDEASYEALSSYERQKEENEWNRRVRIAVKEFFPRHNQLEHGTDFGNNYTPTGVTVGTLEIVTQKAKLHVNSDLLKVKVINAVMDMSYQEQYDLLLYYAPHLADKRRSEQLHGLIGLKGIGTEYAHLGGALWQKGKNGVTHGEDFLKNYKKNPIVVTKIYVNKAIALGIITKGTGGLHLQGNVFLGKDAEDAVVHFSKDIESYQNIIVPEVNKLSQLPEDDLSSSIKERYIKSSFAKTSNTTDQALNGDTSFNLLNVRYLELTGRKANLVGRELAEEVARLEAKLAPPGDTELLIKKAEAINSEDIDVVRGYAKELGVPSWASFKDIDNLKKRIKEFQSMATA